jgi:hypothetical protein
MRSRFIGQQMVELFDCKADNISLHLKNIYKEKELDEPSTTEEFSVVQGHETVFCHCLKQNSFRHYGQTAAEIVSKKQLLEDRKEEAMNKASEGQLRNSKLLMMKGEMENE